LTPTAFLLSVFLTTPALTPGRYVGTAEAGQVWLELGTDGEAKYGFSTYRWRFEGERLVLERPQSRLTLEVQQVADGFVLTGPPFSRIHLRRMQLPTQTLAPSPKRPEAWCGHWRHRATGGQLVLELSSDGRYHMTQETLGSAAQRTSGQWRAAQGLVLTPDGGTPQRYAARVAGGALFLSGGDLPLEVRFESGGVP